MEGKKEKRAFVVFLGEITSQTVRRRGQRGMAANPGMVASRGLNMMLRGAVGTPGSEVTGLPPPGHTGDLAPARGRAVVESGGRMSGVFPT